MNCNHFLSYNSSILYYYIGGFCSSGSTRKILSANMTLLIISCWPSPAPRLANLKPFCNTFLQALGKYGGNSTVNLIIRFPFSPGLSRTGIPSFSTIFSYVGLEIFRLLNVKLL